jgi:rubrerythrin
MNDKEKFTVSALLESISREDFAIHLYGRQSHRDPFAVVPLAPMYYVLNEVYYIVPSPVMLFDLIGIAQVEVEHKRLFTEAAMKLNPNNEPVPKTVFPEDLFETVITPEVELRPGLKTPLRTIITDIVQEQRAQIIYNYFAKETSGQMSILFSDIARQEVAHQKIFERALENITGGKKIHMACPVCGKILELEAEEGFLSGCAFCMSKFVLKIQSDDFILSPRD